MQVIISEEGRECVNPGRVVGLDGPGGSATDLLGQGYDQPGMLLI